MKENITMLSLQKFLENRAIEDLKKDPFNLIISAKNNLVLFKYNQFNSDFSNSIVRESRGIILENGTWKIVCNPFFKFWNYGESHAFNIDLEKSYIIEKVDGSIIKVYFYDEKWRIATNGTIDAKDATTTDKIPFEELFFDIISREDFNILTSQFEQDKTYMFELVHSSARIVVDYSKKELVFIGLKENETSKDFNIFYKSIRKKMESVFNGLPIRFPKLFDLKDVNDIMELSNIADKENLNGNDFEGFVVSQFEEDEVIGRVKIKSPKYIQLHHVATGEGITNNLINVLMNNEMKEFEVYLNKLPDKVREEYKSLKEKYSNLVDYLLKEGEIYRGMSKTMSRKELAFAVLENVNKSLTGIIFRMVDNFELDPKSVLGEMGSKKVKFLLMKK